MTYSLYRVSDGMGDSGPMSMALVPVYDDSGKIIDATYEQNAVPRVGVAMRVGSLYARSYGAQDWWQTTPITEITDEWKDTAADGDEVECVRFKTGNSTYIWKKF